jgi:ABC-2 type transport system permease protein
MAVYKRTYRSYSGPATPAWSRFLILTRYASQGIFRSKFVTAMFALCFFYPLGCAIAIYLNHNSSVLSLVRVTAPKLFDIDGKFFLIYLGVQGTLSFFLTAFIGPGLVSPDMANGALPLYFYRPFSRTEYILGKLFVTARLLSFITWVPGLILFGIESSLSGTQWMSANLRLAAGVFFGAWIWILLISLIALALSAWVRWRIVAGALVLAVMFLGSGFGHALDVVLRGSKIGYFIDPGRLSTTVWEHMLGVETSATETLSATAAWIGLLAICGLCLLLLTRKVRPYEVVR